MKKSGVFDNTKRTTRSQLTLPELNFNLGRSPLKDARTARKHNVTTTDEAALLDGENSDAKSPTDRTPPKRPMSPTRGVTEEDERESKRVKRSENTSPIAERHSAEPIWHSPSRKPVSTYVTHDEVPRTPKTWRRAQSVPPQSSTPKAAIPHINFSRMSPSPWKSPSKAKLRIASVSPMESIPDTKESMAESGSSIPQIEPSVTVDIPDQQEQLQPEIDAIRMDLDSSPSNETTLTEIPVLDDQVTKRSPELPSADALTPSTELKAVADLDVPMASSPIPSPPPSSQPLPVSPELPLSEPDPTTPKTPTPQDDASDPFMRPSSPLSPVPPEHSLPPSDSEGQQELRRSRRKSDAGQLAESLRDCADALTTGVRRPGSVASSIASSSSSRLPRPSSVASSYKSTGTQGGEELVVKPAAKIQTSKIRSMKPRGGTPSATKTATDSTPSTSTSTPAPEPAPKPAPPVVAAKVTTSNNTATKPTATKSTTTTKARGAGVPTGTTPIPLGGRMTRSTALRLQKREEANAGAVKIGPPKTPSRPGSRANSSMCYLLLKNCLQSV
ncbi:hypothetical protein QCA50_005073 [Cerrena zonata]|uniref:Uncharacterized protein n=1 Tax=Cerrena zonata TaxID=2478898 RepID=A0AAW0GQ16_9APHY